MCYTERYVTQDGEATTPSYATNQPLYQSCALCFGKCVGTLNELPISMGELVVPMDFLVLEETPYDILIDLPAMIRLRACPYYYRMVLKFRYGGDYEILNHEYERDSGYNSEDEFASAIADEDEHEVQELVEELVLMVNEPERKTKSSEDDELLHE